jgi:small acid-soluble spore protein (thioredoxin-like protein)
MFSKPDNRADNVEKLQKHIDNTIKNIRKAEDMISLSDSDRTMADLIGKNERREAALNGFRREIKDEADYRNQKS